MIFETVIFEIWIMIFSSNNTRAIHNSGNYQSLKN